jgi:hypothetical protein
MNKSKVVFYYDCNLCKNDGLEVDEGLYYCNKNFFQKKPIFVRLNPRTRLVIQYKNHTKRCFNNPYTYSVITKLDERELFMFSVTHYKPSIDKFVMNRIFSFVDILLFLIIISIIWIYCEYSSI